MLFTPLLALATYAAAAPAAPLLPQAPAAAVPSPTVPYASDDPNYSYLDRYQSGTPEPIIGAAGADILGPQNIPLERESPDFMALPTDSGCGKREVADGDIAQPSARRRMGSSAERTRHTPCDCDGGGGYETEGWGHSMHWHVTAEWGYVMAGSCRVNVVNQLGRNYLADVYPVTCGTSQKASRTQSKDSTTLRRMRVPSCMSTSSRPFRLYVLLTDWMAHVPKEVLAKNFRVNASAFDHIPGEQLWIFPSAVPTESVAEANPVSPQGEALLPYTFAASKAPATNVTGGSVKVVDSRTFNVSTTIAVAEVTVVPGGMRELHWHPTQPEWTFYLEGTARVTVFASSGNARTFDYQAGDIGKPSYILCTIIGLILHRIRTTTFGHYVENTGNTTMKYLEIFKTDIYEDISLNQWLALTPPEMVKAHLQLDDETISQLQKVNRSL
ncbi:Oxalate Decarboxylase [Rhizoctonia solani]|uniref:Oxalate Decarboxylase n=1 Tax=Rhizoctonia solani TaxID=456999 RepID=A0A8H7I8Y1_9AGAM|nr:Oxalate Decarboxylase [Rhizoctonia solani]